MDTIAPLCHNPHPALFQYPPNYRPAIMKTAHSVAAHACGDTQICILLSGAEGGVFVAD